MVMQVKCHHSINRFATHPAVRFGVLLFGLLDLSDHFNYIDNLTKVES